MAAESSKGIVRWRETEDGSLKPFLVKGGESKPIHWAPQPGSQTAFLSCPVWEALIEGGRGGGKTDVLLADFAQDVGKGYGADWNGILFRRTYPELNDVVAKSLKMFSVIFPDAQFNRSKYTWTFAGGERLRLANFAVPSDYWGHHGSSYTWLAWEELTNYPTPECYLSMMSCVRTTNPNITVRIRSSTNPYGPGSSWLRDRFRLPSPPGKISGPIIRDAVGEDGKLEPPRVAIRSRVQENKVLLHADPGYIDRIVASASNEAQREAWLNGDWTVLSGGMFSDLWDPKVHVITNIANKDLQLIPRGWLLNRSYDHGSSKPFSVGWWAESNGEPWVVGDRKIGPVRGDVVRFAEWYGWNGKPNTGLRIGGKKIAHGIIEREVAMGLHGRVQPGPADNSIFDDYDPGSSVAGDMISRGVHWAHSDKSPGSRKQGWAKIRDLLLGALPVPGTNREEPGMFVADSCDQFIRTIPTLVRLDRDLDEIDTRTEDHIADETRYRVRAKDTKIRSGSWR